MTIRMMVLDDEETCTSVEGCAVVEFDNEEDADDFADLGPSAFSLRPTGLTTEVPIYKALKKE